MEEMEDKTSGWSDAFDTEKSVVFIYLLLTMTIECDLSALNSRLARSEQLCIEIVEFGMQKLWRT